jgi:hypothetical protein
MPTIFLSFDEIWHSDNFGTSLGSPPAARIIAASISLSDALPFGRLWYGEPDAISNAIGYAKFRSRSPR